VTVRHDPAGHRFVADTPGGQGELIYGFFADTVLDLEHTEVPPAARGLHVADALIRAALAWAREQGYSVMATCPFSQRWLAAHPDERPGPRA
jgi:predicted GNAT family acetyltransferase